MIRHTILVTMVAVACAGCGTTAAIHDAPVVAASVAAPLAVAPPAPAVVTCQNEDGSGQHQAYPCRWDANTAGLANGGHSFTITRAGKALCFTYDRAKDQRRWGGCG